MRTQAHILDDPATDPFEVAATAAGEIAEKTGVARHDIALTLGSGWAKAADLIGETTATIPASTARGTGTSSGTTVTADAGTTYDV